MVWAQSDPWGGPDCLMLVTLVRLKRVDTHGSVASSDTS